MQSQSQDRARDIARKAYAQEAVTEPSANVVTTRKYGVNTMTVKRGGTYHMPGELRLTDAEIDKDGIGYAFENLATVTAALEQKAEDLDKKRRALAFGNRKK